MDVIIAKIPFVAKIFPIFSWVPSIFRFDADTRRFLMNFPTGDYETIDAIFGKVQNPSALLLIIFQFTVVDQIAGTLIINFAIMATAPAKPIPTFIHKFAIDSIILA